MLYSATWTNTRETASNDGRALDPRKNGPNPGNTAPDTGTIQTGKLMKQQQNQFRRLTDYIIYVYVYVDVCRV